MLVLRVSPVIYFPDVDLRFSVNGAYCVSASNFKGSFGSMTIASYAELFV